MHCVRTCLLAALPENTASRPQLWIAFLLLLYPDFASVMLIICFVLTFNLSFLLQPLSFFYLSSGGAILVSTVDFLNGPMLWLQSPPHSVTDAFPTGLLDIERVVQRCVPAHVSVHGSEPSMVLNHHYPIMGLVSQLAAFSLKCLHSFHLVSSPVHGQGHTWSMNTILNPEHVQKDAMRRN